MPHYLETPSSLLVRNLFLDYFKPQTKLQNQTAVVAKQLRALEWQE